MSEVKTTTIKSIVKANNNARELLIGSKIIDVRYMTPKEVDDMGWYKSGLIIWLKNKKGNTVQLIVQQDDEGNDSGVLDYTELDKEGNIIKDDLFYNIHI